MPHTKPEGKLDYRARYESTHYAGVDYGPLRLAWGQQFIWNIIADFHPFDHRINIAWIEPAPANLSVSDALSAIGRLISRHESLRTMFRTTGSGEPEQVVRGSGNLPVLIWEITAGDPAEVAEEMRTTLNSDRYDLAVEGAVRAGIVADNDSALGLVISLSHVVTDGTGVDILRSDLRTVMGAKEKLEGSPWQPRDQVEFESSADSIARESRATAYARDQFRNFPSTMFPWPPAADPHFPVKEGYLTSSRLLPALSILSSKLKVSPTSAVLAAVSTVLGRRTRREDCCLFVFYANRFSRNSRSVGHYAQKSPVRIDLRSISFWSLIRQTHHDLINAYRYASHSPRNRLAAVAEINRQRGIRISEDCSFNSFWPPRPADDAIEQKDRPAAGSSEDVSTFNWGRSYEYGDSIFYVEAHYPDTISLSADTRYIAAGEFEELLRAIETLLVRGAHDDLDPHAVLSHRSIQHADFGTGWELVDNCWIDLRAVHQMLAEVCGSDSVRVTRSEPPDVRLTAHIPDRLSGISIDELRSSCQEALPRWRSAMVPHDFLFG